MRYIPVLLFLVGVSLPAQQAGGVGCPARDAIARFERQLTALVDSLRTAGPAVPGISLSVIGPRDCFAVSATSGVADRATGVPLTAAHTHRIASNTKTYVAAAVLRLAEDGRLSLDDTLPARVSAGHLAALRRDGYQVGAITLRHLLTHRAGLYDYAMDARFMQATMGRPSYRWTRGEQVDSAVVWGAPYGAPGETFHYTDTGYILLGDVVERVTGQPLGMALRTLLRFDALGLGATWLETLEPKPATAGPWAHQYLGETDTRSFDASVDLFGGGGLAATPMDMARFTRALLAGHVFRLPATLRTMTETVGSEAPRYYAAGIARVMVGAQAGWGHSGFWNTFSYHFPELDVTVAASITQQGAGSVARSLLNSVVPLVPR